MSEPSTWRVDVSGDARGGWHVEIHDGDRLVSYSPVVATAAAARMEAMQAHLDLISTPA